MKLLDGKVVSNEKIEFNAKFLISAVGCLSNANIPNIQGLENFEGNYYHTGNWPKNGVSFVGKNVGETPHKIFLKEKGVVY